MNTIECSWCPNLLGSVNSIDPQIIIICSECYEEQEMSDYSDNESEEE